MGGKHFKHICCYKINSPNNITKTVLKNLVQKYRGANFIFQLETDDLVLISKF